MDRFTRVSIREHLELDNIKELIDNIISHPNRVIINEILKLSKCIKTNIDKLDISELQKEYYKKIIINPEILEEDTKKEDKIKVDEDTSFSFFTIPDRKPVNYEDPKLIKKEFPKYISLNTKKYNTNFRKLSGKILFY